MNATLDYGGVAWTSPHPGLFRFAAKQGPPRPWSWVGQLGRDLSSPTMWLMWGIIGAAIAAWFATRFIPFLMVGTTGFGAYVGMFITVARQFAVSEIVTGTVTGSLGRRRHLLRLESAPRPEIPRDVSVVLPKVARKLLEERQRMDVIALYDPDSNASTVLGWRIP